MSVRAADVTQVVATQDEIAEWRERYPRRHPPYRVKCIYCGKRMWLSGIGIGAHRRACKGGTEAPADPDSHEHGCPARYGTGPCDPFNCGADKPVAPHGWEVKTFDGQRLVGVGTFDDEQVARDIARKHREHGFTTRVRPASVYGQLEMSALYGGAS